MKIENINIKNFKAIRDANEEVEGRNVYLIGGNEAGKTSFIDAVWVGLTGKGIPPEPITKGAKRGVIEIDLGDFIARTKFTKGKPTSFELENKAYDKKDPESERFIKSPRSYMESRIGMLNFDIMDFFAKSDAEKLKYLAKIMDTDFSDLDADIEELMESRKYDKRQLAEVQTKVNYYDPKDAAKELVNVVELAKKITAANAAQTAYDEVLDGIEQRRLKVAEKEAQIQALKIEVETLNTEIGKGEDWLKEKENLPLTEDALKKLTDSLDSVNETNERIKEAKQAKEADEQEAGLEKLIQETTDEIDKKRQEKAARISKHINVPGLTYDAEMEVFLYEGLPFDAKQQNTAAQLIAGMRIASTMLKDLKILKVDASLIDRENFDKVLDWAHNEGIGLFVELVDRDATQLKIHVADE